MPRMILIRDGKNAAAISQMCSESPELIRITKNSYGNMVITGRKSKNLTNF